MVPEIRLIGLAAVIARTVHVFLAIAHHREGFVLMRVIVDVVVVVGVRVHIGAVEHHPRKESQGCSREKERCQPFRRATTRGVGCSTSWVDVGSAMAST